MQQLVVGPARGQKKAQTEGEWQRNKSGKNGRAFLQLSSKGSKNSGHGPVEEEGPEYAGIGEKGKWRPLLLAFV